MRIGGGCVTRLHELSPVFEAVDSCEHILGIGQCEIVYTLLSIGKIKKLVADEVANLFDADRAVEEIVEACGRVEITGVIDSQKIFRDTTVLFEIRRLSGQDVVNEPGPTVETMFASENELGIGQYWIGNVWFNFAKPFRSRRIAVAKLSHQFLSLFAKLSQGWTIGQTRC